MNQSIKGVSLPCSRLRRKAASLDCIEWGARPLRCLRLQKVASIFLVSLLLAGVVACSTSSAEKSRSEAFKQYETIIRWSQWDAAADFLAPEYLEENPISRLDMDRLRLFRVTSYTLRSAAVFDEGMTATQTVEIKMFNNTQAVERTIIDEQTWRYDETSQRWRLYSGLPDPTKRL